MTRYIYFTSTNIVDKHGIKTFGNGTVDVNVAITTIELIREMEEMVAKDIGAQQVTILHFQLLRTEESPEVDVPQA